MTFTKEQNPSHSISRTEADAEIKEFHRLKDYGYPKALQIAINEGKDESIKNFYSTQKNGFIIEREEILKFFNIKEEAIDAENDTSASHLLLILAAHTERNDDFVDGSPTVIITGVKPVNDVHLLAGGDDDSYLFQTTFGEEEDAQGRQQRDSDNGPGVQWEKQYTINVLPASAKPSKNTNNKILFTVK